MSFKTLQIVRFVLTHAKKSSCRLCCILKLEILIPHRKLFVLQSDLLIDLLYYDSHWPIEPIKLRGKIVANYFTTVCFSRLVTV